MRPTWEQGDVQLYLGDCLEVLPTLEAGSVDAVVTDPPYGLGGWSSSGGNSISQAEADALNKWDKPPPRLPEILSAGHVAVCWGGNHLMGILGACRAPLIWDKGLRGMHFADGEMAWTNFDWGTLRILNLPIGSSDTKGRKVHPTQKPTGVMIWSIEKCKVPAGGLVCDPFMGSGTTGVACVKTGRKFIGIEIDEGYFDIAVKRISEAQMQPRLL